MGREIQSIIIEEIERENDLYKKMELVTIALRDQIEHTMRLENIISKQQKALDLASELGNAQSRSFEIVGEKIKDIYKHLSELKSPGQNSSGNTEIITLKRNISLLQENMQEIYELIINMK